MLRLYYCFFPCEFLPTVPLVESETCSYFSQMDFRNLSWFQVTFLLFHLMVSGNLSWILEFFFVSETLPRWGGGGCWRQLGTGRRRYVLLSYSIWFLIIDSLTLSICTINDSDKSQFLLGMIA